MDTVRGEQNHLMARRVIQKQHLGNHPQVSINQVRGSLEVVVQNPAIDRQRDGGENFE